MFFNPCPVLLLSWPGFAVSQALPQGWRFDVVSFAIGLLVAWLLVGLAYRYRARVARFRGRVQDQARRFRQRLTADMATRYSESVVEVAQRTHLLGTLATLDQIYVEMQLHAPLAAATDETEGRYLSPLQAIQASNRLAIIGQPGSGRTTLLNHLLLLYVAKLVAREGRRVPVYVYLPALAPDLTGAEPPDDQDNQEGEKAAPTLASARLVQAAVSTMSRLVATGVSRWLRREIEGGNALVLLDGWDQVAVRDRAAVTAWVQELFTAYPDNQLVVTAGDAGYAPLVEAGFVPLRPVPWTRRQFADLTRRWTEALRSQPQYETVMPDAPAPKISYGMEPPTPLEATIELIIQLRGETPASTPASRMAQVMDVLLPSPQADAEGQVAWPPETGHRALGRLAFVALERGGAMLERGEIQSTVTQAMPAPQFVLDEDEDVDKEALRAAREEKERCILQVVDCCRALTADGGPIRAFGNRRYLFVHPLLVAYWAAHHLANETGADGVGTVIAHIEDPDWAGVLRFYAGLADPEALVRRLLGVPDDLFLNRFWKAASLLAATRPGRASWREALMKRLAQLLMNVGLPTLLRDRALAALVSSGEAGVGLLFQRAARHPDPHLRAGAILGLGVLEREQDLSLIEAALDDDDLDVRLAAVDALGRLSLAGSETAMELIVAGMIEAEDEVQRVAAEALAALEPDGHAVLRDAARDQDLIVRRAAVYGLLVVGEPWAKEILEEMQGDDEWLVRNVALEALARMGGEEGEEAPPIDLTLPQAETEPWLIAWAAERGEGTGVGDAALDTLTRALNEGDGEIRQAAVETCRRLADPGTIDALRQRLRDPEPAVRQAALAALEEISRRHGTSISPR